MSDSKYGRVAMAILCTVHEKQKKPKGISKLDVHTNGEGDGKIEIYLEDIYREGKGAKIFRTSAPKYKYFRCPRQS